ncbi:MAG: hypothetical protein DRJ03_03020 [Chloroflexi bacterium]|nr:MAG: hypothetical protein DRJ03_03020 [Chloroflexota bacterium]
MTDKSKESPDASHPRETPCYTQWISVAESTPETLVKVLVIFVNETGRKWTSIAMHVPDNEVPADYFMSEEWFEMIGDGPCEYAPGGWYEWTYEHEQYMPLSNVVAWMPLPPIGNV